MMAAVPGAGNRTVLPRWRAWRIAEKSGELDSLHNFPGNPRWSKSLALHELAKRFAAFEDEPGIYQAADVVATALTLGLEDHPKVKHAASLLHDAPLAVTRQLADRAFWGTPSFLPDSEISPGIEVDSIYQRIAKLRRIVRNEPRNSLRWVDLSLAHVTAGEAAHAEREMRIALNLAGSNRFVLRAAARFFVYRLDPESAHNILSRDKQLLISDPWLLAAEIAIAELADRPVRHLKQARQLLESDLDPKHISELASAVGTLELGSGRVKKARQLFSRALIDPTDNSLAQAEWSVKHGIDIVDDELLQIYRGYEARARHQFRTGKFEDAVTQSRLWQKDQPFALDPAAHSSYVASILTEDYPTAIAACKEGLVANPGNPTLLNNLAFAQASSGFTEEATKALNDISTGELSTTKKAVLRATQGLIAFREGNLYKGRAFYRDAVEKLSTAVGAVPAAIAASLWAREEFNVRSEYSLRTIEVAEALADRSESLPEIDVIKTRLLEIRARLAGQ